MIEPGHRKLSIRKQARLLGVNRNRLAKKPHPPRADRASDEEVLAALDRLHTRWPFYGQRKLRVELLKLGLRVNRKRLRRLMEEAGIEVIAPKPTTSMPNIAHRKYPYLLRGLEINRADQVWCADITYIKMDRGHAYLVAVMDWHTRAVLSWKLSNTLDTAFCLEALKEAVATAGTVPEIFNTDQGCQFTSNDWIHAVEGLGIKVSMDGRGRWMDNVFIERLWRSLKCERIYLSSYRNLVELQAGIAEWMRDYNHERIHEALDYAIPWQVYRPESGLAEAA
jgi:putative transposase